MGGGGATPPPPPAEGRVGLGPAGRGTASYHIWCAGGAHIVHVGSTFKGTIPPCSKFFFHTEIICQKFQHIPLVMLVTFFQKYCVTCTKSTRQVLINFGFVTSFEDSHYTLLFRYIYGARVIQWFCYSKYLHVNCRSCQWSKWSIATSLSPKCYSANVPLDFCTTADEIKYFFFSTKALLAFWVIPNWFSKFCRQNDYLNSKLMLRWDSHFNGSK